MKDKEGTRGGEKEGREGAFEYSEGRDGGKDGRREGKKIQRKDDDEDRGKNVVHIL